MTKHARTSMVFVVVVLMLETSGFAQDVAIVVPNEYENVEAPDAGGTTFVFPDGYRLQGVFASSEFGSLPATHQTLTGLYLRPDGPTGIATSVSWNNFILKLSITRPLSILIPTNREPIKAVMTLSALILQII